MVCEDASDTLSSIFVVCLYSPSSMSSVCGEVVMVGDVGQIVILGY